MKVTVEFFSYLRDLAGTSKTEVDLPDLATVADLAQALQERFPRLVPSASSTTYAIDYKAVPREAILKDGQHLSAFLSLVGGAGSLKE
jgi:molybdopterin converting factor small subunit